MIEIRKANASDVQPIYDLRKRSILAKCADHYQPEQLALWTQGGVSEQLKEDIVATFYVSEVDGNVVGCGKLNTETGMVDAIFVDPPYFGLGAAKKMLAFLEQMAREHKLDKMVLEATLNAAPFYRSCGFHGEEISTYHSPRGVSLDCVVMEKPLQKERA
ncbi:GNAT family acetyltransferase [Vibrio variabilis]|uniref:GNAT family acetyltransferase n=1 Tax=Vibrio variabilis TaxID=990271 RepID=A0ABR4YGP5_9VIBR|nr:GNAT family N-acetyltransferase [Vibrio variabilis]KHA62097.1 GNAT family acetyltransferase [Vibrio variabilis]